VVRPGVESGFGEVISIGLGVGQRMSRWFPVAMIESRWLLSSLR
jgi:hypothetical protein